MNNEKIVELKNGIASREEQITKIREEIKELEHELLEKKTGLKAGDLVINKKGEKGILCFGDQWTTSWCWRKVKKDGNPSSVVTYIYGEIEKVNK